MSGIKQINTSIGNKPKTKRTKTKMQPQDEWLNSIIDEHLTEVDSPPRGGVFHPSALGNPCDRYLWLYYNSMLPEQLIEPRVRRIFQNGEFLEDRVGLWFSELNILLDREISLKQEIPPLSGRMDFLIKHYEYGEHPVELKSINKSNFTKLRGPKNEHYIQLQVYMNMGNYDHGTVLYECKDDQNIKSFVIEKDIEIWDNIIKRCFDIQNMIAKPEECTGIYWCPCRKVKEE